MGDACRKRGKFLGLGGVYDHTNAVRYIQMGARFILSGADHAYLMAGAAARTEFLRDIKLAAPEAPREVDAKPVRRKKKLERV